MTKTHTQLPSVAVGAVKQLKLKKQPLVVMDGKAEGPRERYEKHGMTKTPEYRIWNSMRDRCHNPKAKAYAFYGARGIEVCAQWLFSFKTFLQDMGPRPSRKHSIDRKDGTKGYSPENCRWATKAEQDRNKRDNIYVELNGQRYIASDIARKIGLNPTAFIARLKLGWPLEAALRAPLHSKLHCYLRGDYTPMEVNL